MVRHARFALVFALVGSLLLAPASVAKRQKGQASYVPVLADGAEESLVNGAYIKELPGITLILKQLPGEERQEYLTRNLGVTVDPFAVSPGKPERFHIFQLVIENRTEAELSFNPRSAWLMPSDKRVQSPIGLTELSFDYKTLGGELPPAYEKIRSVLFEQSISVRPGEAISGLLAYKPVEPRVKAFRVDLRIVTGEADVVPFAATYLREDLAEKKARKKKKRGDDEETDG